MDLLLSASTSGSGGYPTHCLAIINLEISTREPYISVIYLQDGLGDTGRPTDINEWQRMGMHHRIVCAIVPSITDRLGPIRTPLQIQRSLERFVLKQN